MPVGLRHGPQIAPRTAKNTGAEQAPPGTVVVALRDVDAAAVRLEQSSMS